MKKFYLSACAVLAVSMQVMAQTDTLYVNHNKIACSVKEVTPDAVKFSYPNEEVLNSVYKNTVQKIVFKSGRVATFSEASSFKPVSGVEDYAKVTIAAVESEVKGLYKIGEVGAKAKGTTVLSNQERVKDRAYRKLKMQAAMQGANVIYITQQRNEGNKYGGYYQSGSSTETNLTGISYSDIVPDLAEFKKLLNSRSGFGTYEKYSLGASSSEYSKTTYLTNFTLTDVHDENGVIIVEGNLEDQPKFAVFKLAGFDKDHFSLFYQDKGTVYSVSVKM